MQVLVGSASFEHDFDVVFVFGLVRRGLFHIDHGTGLDEGVIGVAFRSIEGYSFVGVETAGEVIAVNNTEHTAVDVQVGAQVQVPPRVVLSSTVGQRNLVALQEDALWDPTVLHLLLNYVKGVIVQVVVYYALSYSVVLVRVLYNWLLEVGRKVQHL